MPEAPQVGVGLAPARAVTIIRTYLRAFFDQWLRGRPNDLLDGPWDRYPEVKYYPPT